MQRFSLPQPESPPQSGHDFSNQDFSRSEFSGQGHPQPGPYAEWVYQGMTIAAMLLVLASICLIG